jgi:hypothetical protein
MTICHDCKYAGIDVSEYPCRPCVDYSNWEPQECAATLQSKITNCIRMIAGGKSSPDYPANLPALLDEIKEELER